MNFTDIFIKRPVLACVISLMILLIGLRAIGELSLRQFPKMENTVITVTTAYPGANADLMQGFITSPLQKSIASAEGIDYMTAQSVDGLSTISAYIKLNFDPAIAMTDIMSQVQQVSDQLPKESNKPVIQKSTGNSLALMYIGFNSKNMSTQQITDYLVRVVQPKLQTVGGVSSAQILGGQAYAMRIWLNTNRMAALSVTAEDVINAIEAQNFQAAAGQMKGKFVLYNINAKTNTVNEEQFNNIVVKSQKATLIRFKDIGRVELGAQSHDSSVIFNGKNAVFIGIQSTPTANPLTVIDDVKKLLPELSRDYPPSFEGKVVYDSTDYIRSSIHEVMRSISEASLIVIIVVFLFLGSFRTVMIPIITIPLSLIGVCSLMYAMGYSLNLLTLLAMVLAIGLVVDDAIVVVENIYRHIEEGLTPFQAAIKGAHEIATPIISMTTTLAAVYAPIGFMTGMTGALFKEFAFTLAFCVILSGVIALTLSPMMCSKILNSHYSQQKLVKMIDEIFEKLKTKYTERLQRVLNIRPVVIVFSIIILVFCGFLAKTTMSELAPDEDQSALFASLSAPQYANINYTTQFTSEFENIYKKIPEAEDYFVVNGSGGVNNAFAGLILKPWNKRKKSQDAILAEVQPQLGKIAGLQAVAFPLPSIPGQSDGLPVQFVLTSTADYTVLYQVVEKLKTEAMKSGLFMYADTDLKFNKPELVVNINRDKAASMGVTMQNIGTTLAVFLGGNYVNRFDQEGQSYQVIPQVPRQFRYDPDKINNYYVMSSAANVLVPLGSLVDLTIHTVPNQLNQFQQLNSATLQGMTFPGKSTTQALNFLREKAKEILPMGVSFDYGGQSRQTIQEGNTLIYTFFFALIIIYLVLAAQFESFRDPFIILISVPMSIAGALLPLNIFSSLNNIGMNFGISLNIYSGIGLITLIGLISKHGILMVDFANKLQHSEKLSIDAAIVKSAALRLRPILMTTAAMILGVFPLILASGAGAKSRMNIGIVIACGMLIGTCFTLFVVPTMYTLLARKQ
ncbi:MAG TPA: efflux RND transporter permease subunit [Gammaproteobacteria bacterium]|nr:efflux RND transporter permease subunit [Gammaproteobacteria bacterium]